ncbi:MAG: hypothetical protein NVS3B10_25750 [Polyangiales bacterium]
MRRADILEQLTTLEVELRTSLRRLDRLRATLRSAVLTAPGPDDAWDDEAPTRPGEPGAR